MNWIGFKTDFTTNRNNDIGVTVLFGVLSAVLGLIKIDTPGFEGSYSDLREVALILAIFHLRNPIYILPLCILTLLGLSVELRLIPVVILHYFPLTITWFVYKSIERKNMSSIQLGMVWYLVALVYYLILLYPALIFSYWIFGFNENLRFKEAYMSLFTSGMLEMIATSIISSIYLIQLNIRRKLERTNKNLERIVEERTIELQTANDELKTINENLEDIVKERTDKIDSQYKQILKYVHMNSHEVRAPLARLLGLIQLINKEKEGEMRKELLHKLGENSEELDSIVRKMNRLLEKEI